jgi:N-acetylmuramoyl-L-alanine amidase
MQHLKKWILLFLTCALVVSGTPGVGTDSVSEVSAATKQTVKYRYKGKTKTYKGTKRTLTYNGKTVSLTQTPVLVLNSVHMVPYYEVFVKNTIHAEKSYQSKTKTLVLTGNGHTIKVQAESKTAYVDGQKKTLSTAPKMITYQSSKKTRLLVPLKDFASYLGIGYQWTKKTGAITLTCQDDSDNKTSISTSTDVSTTAEDTSESTENFSSIDAIDSDEEESGQESDSSFSYTMSLKRPTSVAKGTIICQDDYHNKRLKIIIPGDWVSFYKSNKPSVPSGVTFKCKYSSSSNKTTLTFTTKTIKGFQVKEDGSRIYIRHGSPKSIYKNIIVLDAGHGGHDSGATGYGYKEKNLTLSIVKAAKKYFDTDSNFKVYYTRLSDTYPSLSDRYKLANEVGADMFISVHINSAGKSAKGTETLYNPDRNKKSSAGLSCYKLAANLHKYIKAATGFTDRGLKKRCHRLGNGLAVLSNNNGPATLTEIGFITNKSEVKKMNKNASSYGKAIYNAVVSISSKYPTGR